MIQSLNLLFHFYKLINIDNQEINTKNKEINFQFEINDEIISVRKTREIFENKAHLDEIINSELGFHEIDYLNIFIWKKKAYTSSSGLPYKSFLVKVKNIYLHNVSHNFDTISFNFSQDRLDIPIIVTARNLMKGGKSLELSKEKNILKFKKNEKILIKSIDIIHELNNLF
jgi:hypothetical protein